MNPFAKVSRYSERHAMLKAARGVVVAVSGGPDSIALLDLLLRLREKEREKGSGGEGKYEKKGAARLAGSSSASPLPHSPSPPLPFFIHVAHLNHQLRGAAADEDAEFVRQMAERLSLPVTIECADVRAAAEATRRGIEETAREIRYNFLLRVALATDSSHIATGHTMSDQAETFLMRLVRGAGSRGLAAMRPCIAAHQFSEDASRGAEVPEPALPCSLSPLLIRPLLAITRDEVEAYCDERQLSYRIDATNEAGAFTRNRVRREVLPVLHAINPQVVEAIARTAENLAAEQDALDELAKTFLAAARIAPTRTSGNHASSEVAAYRIEALCEQPAGLQRRMLIAAIQQVRAFARTDRDKEITATHIAAIESLLAQAASGKRRQLPGGLEVWREFEAIVFKQRVERAGESIARAYSLELSASQPRVEADGIVLLIERELPINRLPSLMDEAQWIKEKGGRDWLIAFFDDERLPANLLVRPRQCGERLRVRGHQQTIKLKKLMIDHTIPASRRAAWPVVTTADDRYVWSPGLPPSVDFAARDETRTLAIVRALNI